MIKNNKPFKYLIVTLAVVLLIVIGIVFCISSQKTPSNNSEQNKSEHIEQNDDAEKEENDGLTVQPDNKNESTGTFNDYTQEGNQEGTQEGKQEQNQEQGGTTEPSDEKPNDSEDNGGLWSPLI